jgi:hypothetical protein
MVLVEQVAVAVEEEQAVVQLPQTQMELVVLVVRVEQFPLQELL